MAENKTKATLASPARYIATIDDEARRRDCEQLVGSMSKAMRQKPVMSWGAHPFEVGT
jgi:hypothetical protein